MTIRFGSTQTPGTGTIIGANNGVQVDGTGTLVELGGALIQPTTIDVANFDLIIQGLLGTDHTFFRINGNTYTMQVRDDTVAALKESLTQQSPHTNVVLVRNVSAALTTGLEILPFDPVTPRNVFLDDILQSGLSNKADYRVNGLINYGGLYVPVAFNIPIKQNSAEVFIQTTSVNIGVFVFSTLGDTVNDLLLRISCYMDISLGPAGSTLKITATFTNTHGVLQTIDLSPTWAQATSSTGSVAVMPVTLKCFRNTQVSINTVAVNVPTYQAGYSIERLYV